MIKPKEKFMNLAIEQAKLAGSMGEYPVGAVLVFDGEVLSAQGNRTRSGQNPIAHAETLAILEGTEKKHTKHLPGCMLYSTHEPCAMCTGVALWAKISYIVFGATIKDIQTFRRINGNNGWRHIDVNCKELIARSTEWERVEVVEEFMRQECLKLFR